jgi:predicted MFS family arabinose efflux permease
MAPTVSARSPSQPHSSRSQRCCCLCGSPQCGRYPALGVEAVRRAPPQSRGLVMGMYTAFLDVALGFGTPALELIAGPSGLGTVFLASALAVLAAMAFAVVLLDAPTKA